MNGTTPTVSVLLPVRDAAATLPAALRSIARQTESDFECLIVDDGSRDDSLAIAREFARSDARFRPLARNAEGLVPALNTGLGSCRGRYVARMDADDVMHRCRLALQRDALDAQPELDAVGCHVRLFPESAVGPGMREYEAWLCSLASAAQVERDAFIECPIAHPTLFARRDALRTLGYRDAGWPEDYDLVLRWLARGGRIGVVPERLLAWRVGDARLSRTSPTYAIERFVACKAHHLAGGFLAASRDFVLWGYGGTGRALRGALAEHGKAPSHIVELHPGRIGQRIHGAAVIAPAALPGLRGARILVSVAGAGPRREIRDALAGMGFRDGEDYLCTA